MTVRAWLASAIGYVLVTLVLVSPLIDFRHMDDASYQGDARLLIWTLAWDAHALLAGEPLFHANMFFPEPESLRWAEHHVGIAVFALPVYAITGNAVIAYWVVWLLAFPLNALAMQALAYRVTRDGMAAFGAGLVYAFCFFRMHHAHGHVQMLWTWPLPLALLAFEQWLARPSFRTTASLTALVLTQALSGWYLAVTLALLLAVTAALLLAGRRPTKHHVVSGAIALALTASVLVWFAAPYTGVPGVSVEEVAGNSADVASYLVPPENTWPGRLIAEYSTLRPRWIWGEQTLYVGAVTVLLAVVGLWALRGRRDRLTTAILAAGAVALALSFGPGGGTSAFDLLTSVPVMSLLRAPGRFALLVMMALALLVAIGAAHIRSLGRRWAPAALMILALLGLSESYVVGFPGGKPPQMPIPAVYHHLKTLPPGPVLSLPTYRFAPDGFREADYLLFSTAHWQPVVNGFGRHEPPAHLDHLQIVSRFPAADAIRRLRELGVRYVILHTARATELRTTARDAETNPAVTLVGRFGDDVLFTLVR